MDLIWGILSLNKGDDRGKSFTSAILGFGGIIYGVNLVLGPRTFDGEAGIWVYHF